MSIAKFEIGKTYRGVSGVGTIALTVVKRTEKTVTVKTVFGENRVKIRNFYQDQESAIFKSWSFSAGSEYSEEKQLDDAYYAAYN